jgi:hypothetical protein
MYEHQQLKSLIEVSTALKTSSRFLTRLSAELVERSRESITSSRALLASTHQQHDDKGRQ